MAETSATFGRATTINGVRIDYAKSTFSFPDAKAKGTINDAWDKVIEHYMALGLFDFTYVSNVPDPVIMEFVGEVEGVGRQLVRVSVIAGKGKNCDTCGTPNISEHKPSWCGECESASPVAKTSNLSSAEKIRAEYMAKAKAEAEAKAKLLAEAKAEAV